MNPDIQRRWEGVETRRVALVQRVRELDGPTKITRPMPGGLSPVEVIKHIALSESHGLELMKKHPPSTLKRVTQGPMFPQMLAKMRNPVAPIPTLPSMMPKGQVDLEMAAHEWERIRKTMVPYFAECQSLQSPMVKHFFMIGTLSCGDYLDLLEAHLHYHETRLTSK